MPAPLSSEIAPLNDMLRTYLLSGPIGMPASTLAADRAGMPLTAAPAKFEIEVIGVTQQALTEWL